MISFICVLRPRISLRISMMSEAVLCIDCVKVLAPSSTFSVVLITGSLLRQFLLISFLNR
jgi:hypothetical protein